MKPRHPSPFTVALVVTGVIAIGAVSIHQTSGSTPDRVTATDSSANSLANARSTARHRTEIRGDEVFEASSAIGLARLSQTVVVGRVTAVRFEVRNSLVPGAEDGIYSVEVDRALRGQGTASKLAVRVFSRIDGNEAVLEGQDPPVVGQRYLLFLRRHPRLADQYEITNSKGAYKVAEDGRISRTTALDDLVVRGLNGRSIDEVARIVTGE